MVTARWLQYLEGIVDFVSSVLLSDFLSFLYCDFGNFVLKNYFIFSFLLGYMRVYSSLKI